MTLILFVRSFYFIRFSSLFSPFFFWDISFLTNLQMDKFHSFIFFLFVVPSLSFPGLHKGGIHFLVQQCVVAITYGLGYILKGSSLFGWGSRSNFIYHSSLSIRYVVTFGGSSSPLLSFLFPSSHVSLLLALLTSSSTRLTSPFSRYLITKSCCLPILSA